MIRAAALAVAVLLPLLLLPLLAHAQSGPDAGAPSPDAQAASDAAAAADAGVAGDAARASADGGAVASFEPPRLLSDRIVPPPPNAPPITGKIVVTVKLLVDVTGAVQKVELKTPPQPPFDDAVVAATKTFRFQPARYAGAPVPVEITFTNTFVPPPPPPAPVVAKDEGPALTSLLRGRLVDLGTRAPVAGATVTAVVGDRHYSVDADARGRFRLPLPPGPANVSVYAASHNPFVQQETLIANQELGVKYLIERDRYDPFEIIVIADRKREEVSRITLRGAEIKQIPGTFGDPFRVIQTLPGVASVVSLLPYPVVRGASPSSTGFLLDGTRVPLLYHLLLGTSVIHPEMIDEIQFYPGGAPASYGGYTGGIIDGRTARARPDEHLIDFDANLLQVGGFVREPIKPIGATVTAAARYGYPGFLLSLATDRLSLSYWDYQLRLDGGTARNGWTVFFFGANDELDTVAATADPNAPNPPLTPTLVLGFHRGDLRYHHADGELEESLRLVLGYDHTFSMGNDFSVLVAEPTATVRWVPTPKLTLDLGVLAYLHKVDQGTGQVTTGATGLAALTSQLDKFYGVSSYLEALWRPTPRILIRPGVRFDTNADGTTTKSDVDPRLTVRYKLADRNLPDVPPGSDDGAIWLKGSAGIYHQPPRFVLPLPGLDMMPLKYGLLRSYQTSLGVEIPLEQHFQFNVEGYFNYMDPTIFDLQLNDPSVVTSANTGLLPTSIVTPQNAGQMFIDRLTQPETGRAYGGEVLIRRQSKTGVFGWLSYTLSRSERLRSEMINGQTKSVWVPYDFDRTHLVNLVAGMPLRRNWDIGMRWQYQSGTPTTVTSGYNAARANGYLRLDLRIDKRAVYRKWLLDFYVDITNIAVLPEEIQPGTVIRYVLPTVGLRGRL